MRLPRPGGRRSVTLGAACLLALSASALRSQCPDGSPPPFRSATSTALTANTARRPAPLIDQHAWVVVPFADVTKSRDLDWLRDASVNLLSLDLGRWTDISVVDDKRVADLLRDVPLARTGQPLTLSDGLALARRAGAGNLVMGDFIRVGRTTRLVATVIDVRSGNKVRSVEQQTANDDSLLTAFTPLARGVLAVPPPPDARLGSLGTSRTDAYREYLLGVNALNRFDITEAERHLTTALALDRNFALAHFKLSLAMGWREGTRDLDAERTHAAAAAQLGTALPPRERTLIGGRLAEASNDYPKACTLHEGLVARDSTDVEAVYHFRFSVMAHLQLVQYQSREVSTKSGELQSYLDEINVLRSGSVLRHLRINGVNHRPSVALLSRSQHCGRTSRSRIAAGMAARCGPCSTGRRRSAIRRTRD